MIFLKSHPELRLYGEYLVPHTLKTYYDEAWNKFYVFDVVNESGYLPYEEYKAMLDEYDIEYIPPLCKIVNPVFDNLVELLDKKLLSYSGRQRCRRGDSNKKL